MNFERGIDPKSAMGIGRRDKIKRMMKEDGWEYTDDAALQWASKNGRIEIVKFLLDEGVDIHVNDDIALRSASVYRQIEVIKFLLDAGADVHADDDFILKYGHVDIIEELLKKHLSNEF